MPASVRIALTAVLGVALAGEAAVLYAVVSPDMRLVAGMGIVVAVVGVTAALARATTHRGEVAPARRFHARRFVRLRSWVELFLEQVRQLNRVAVAAARGVRDRASAREEIDTIEERLTLLVREIRGSVGVQERIGASTGSRPNAGGGSGRGF